MSGGGSVLLSNIYTLTFLVYLAHSTLLPFLRYRDFLMEHLFGYPVHRLFFDCHVICRRSRGCRLGFARLFVCPSRIRASN